MEEYRIIIGFEKYSVSNFGNVKTNKTGKILKSSYDKDGYNRLVIRDKNGKKSCLRIHRLVCIMFLNNPENKPFVDHIDGNKQNNNINNLRWCTNQENQRNTKLSSRNTSNVKGVAFRKENNKFRASITIDGIWIHIGYYNTLEEAQTARINKAKAVFKEFVHNCENF